ncbi:hypothetical protein [Desulfosporosinus sp. FKB]|uniref:hypothetical protein n=1 Tax=Desulfosporosinus sp. FKB TaxID=1969835 RepID=UPI000B4A0277|nr:hypothetical protein [Desulfosporosinus sp. FKB]
MLLSYGFSNNCIYIPLHLNTIFFQGEINFEKDYVNLSLVESIFEEVSKTKAKYYFLDFCRIKMTESRVFEIFADILSSTEKTIIFVNLNNRISNFIHNADCYGLVIYDKTKTALSNHIGIEFIDSIGNYQEYIIDYKKKIIGLYVKEIVIMEEQFLESSSVYSNMYVDIKKIFNNRKMYSLIIYELCNLVVTHFNKRFDALVSSSNNGSALSTIIGKILNKDVLYLMNLGPHLTIRDKELLNSIIPKKRYLFIYDFICLGTEFKITKTVVNTKDADLVGAVGVAKYRFEDRENKHKVFSLIDINTDCNLSYEVYFEKREHIEAGEG